MNTLADLFRIITETSISSEKYVPYRPGLSWSEYEIAHKSNPVINKLVKMRNANVNANGWEVRCTLFNQESRNERVSDKVFSMLDDRIKLNKLITEIVVTSSIFGTSYIVFNSDNIPIVHKPSMFNLYFDSVNKKSTKIKLLIDGKESEKTYEEGKDIFIFREPDTTFKPLGDSPIDSCYEWYLLYQHAVQVNNNFISRGNIGTIIAMFEREMQAQMDKVVDKETGEKGWQAWVKQFKQSFNGSKNSNKLAIAFGVKEFLDISKSNNDLQLSDLLDRAEQGIFQSFGFTKTGENSTYNNAKTFSYEQWDNVGRGYEKQIENFVNSFLLPYFGLEVNQDFYFSFNLPSDPDEVANKTMFITAFKELIGVSTNVEYKAKITNILLDKLGLETIDEKILEEQAPPQLPVNNGGQNVIDATSNPVETGQPQLEGFAEKKKLTPTQEALKSTDYNNPRTGKGFLPQWEKAITKQVEAFIEKLEKSTQEKALTVVFPKIETYYSINALKGDLLRFVDLAITTEAFADNNLDSYPKYILDFVDGRASDILKGNADTFKSVDEETSSQILTILKNNIDKGLDTAIEAIATALPELAKNRATIIAETEVSNAVEGTRYLRFSDEGYKYKRLLNVGDNRVSEYCVEADSLGVVPIDYEYNGAFGKSKTLPLHPRERSTMVFGMTEDEIS